MAMPGTTTTNVDTELAARMRLAVGRLARQLRRRSSAGLTLSQLSALASVERLEPVRIGDLAAREGVAAPTMTRIAAAMVEAGLCERRGCPDDARSSLLTTTEAGREALRAVRQERTELLVTQLQALPAEQRESLADAVRLLEALVEGDDA
jgi:DNA-binding MarR family transcriptional regulator